MFVGFLCLTIMPLYSTTPLFNDTIFTSSILLSQFLFWGVWYGLCLFSVIPFGRLWCGVLCPLGAVSQWAGKLGPGLKMPKWMRWDGWLLIMFFGVTILGQTLDVRDDPIGLSKLFLYIFILAIIIGLLFGKKGSRPWCRYFCPIGKILGIVSRLGAIDFRPHKIRMNGGLSKPLYIEGRLCPTDYNLPYKVSSNNCIACGACIHGKKKSGLGLYTRKIGTENFNITKHDASWSEVLFILFSPGLCAGGFLWLILHQYQVFHDQLGTWFLERNDLWFFHTASSWISSQTWNQHFNWLDILTIILYMLSYSIIVGLALSALMAISSLLLRSKIHDFKKVFISLVYQFNPVAILSIVIGLCGKFFEVMHHDFSMSNKIASAIKLLLLLASMLWTLQLSWKKINSITKKSTPKACMSFISILICTCLILYMWWPAIFNLSYMSVVEQIRKHIIVPG